MPFGFGHRLPTFVFRKLFVPRWTRNQAVLARQFPASFVVVQIEDDPLWPARNEGQFLRPFPDHLFRYCPEPVSLLGKSSLVSWIFFHIAGWFVGLKLRRSGRWGMMAQISWVSRIRRIHSRPHRGTTGHSALLHVRIGIILIARCAALSGTTCPENDRRA